MCDVAMLRTGIERHVYYQTYVASELEGLKRFAV
jgi:hypothetical protein